MAKTKSKVARLLEGRDPVVLAQAIAVDPWTVERWKKGSFLPKRSIVPALAVALGITETELRNAVYTDKLMRKQKAGAS